MRNKMDTESWIKNFRYPFQKQKTFSKKSRTRIRVKFGHSLIPVSFFYVPPYSDNDNTH